MFGDGPVQEDSDEWTQFKSLNRLPFKSAEFKDPLSWWRKNAKRFPCLAGAARNYLAVPGTSAASERVFSSGRHLVSEFRQKLGEEMIRTCMLVKCWMDIDIDSGLTED